MNLRQAIEVLLDRMPPEVTDEGKLDFLERYSWLVDDNGTELFRIREEWIRERRLEYLPLAMLPWSSAIGRSKSEATSILSSIGDLKEYQGRIEERLWEHERRGR